MLRRIVIGLAAVALMAFGVAVHRFNQSGPATQPLSGATRASFVRSANDACAAQKKASPENADAGPERIAAFCDCYAETLAARVSTADLDRLAGRSPADIQADMRPKMDDADEACAAKIDVEGK